MNPARLAAARILIALDRGSTTLSHELDRVRPTLPRPDDRSLLLELVAGTLRWRNELDALVAGASRRSVPDLDDDVRAVLRLAAYQLRHLDRVPPHAVLHESVSLVRELHRPGAAGFVNGVLRTITRSDPAAHLPARPADGRDRAACLAYLSTTLSHPDWLVARWFDRYGFEGAEAWCRHNNSVPEVTVRVRRERVRSLASDLETLGFSANPGRFVDRCVRLAPGTLSQLPADLRESLVVQDEGSQLVAASVPLSRNACVLDACAAPGGKTLLLADSIQEDGRLIASDFRPGRVALLARTLATLDRAVPIVRLDASRPLPFGACFDTVLLDVPCTGLGTLRRDPDIKWARSPEDLVRFAATQGSMLRAAAACVRPGGALVYATCSSEPEENAGVVDAFLATHPTFSLRPVTFGPGVRRAGDLVDSRGCLATDPVRHGLDAFFAAVLVRREGA